jgi:hypothetical protein
MLFAIIYIYIKLLMYINSARYREKLFSVVILANFSRVAQITVVYLDKSCIYIKYYSATIL